RLDVRRGNCAPVTAMEFRAPGPIPPSTGGTEAYAESRFGHLSVVVAFFQRLSVTPDGSGVVSSCDPFGTNPYGGQLFAMRPDGTKLRQLTATHGRVVEDGGVVSVELPGPRAYSARPRSPRRVPASHHSS